ncbi:ABC transporter related protein [Syntrophobotulus glycolicus DSM 8271]|uniref:ABC transporter related protein n=1 Tax=Syntrophobotulus glycolicus (strain DSM 8271 / FlGlyR) TaxID=645991 RepID=F0SUN2_SYNGF|nr:ABC transporter ATP-binding protein [Syntrophobotulus glycolicus]ADY55525.1 ABC transporter related protein [Syntrophobotulus glycolicus DSM 8271]
MIDLHHVSFHYTNAASGSLRDISLQVERGKCVLLCGQSGCGKTTLTRLINGLIPHYYEGELSGKVTVGGLDIKNAELYETARLVGSVFQNPRSQFFCVDTTGEIAFGCENLGLPPAEIDRRVALATRELHATDLLGRSIFHLSGGEKQKIACASVSAMGPEVFVLDEPTSNLDIRAIRDLKDTIRLWKAQGKTILIAEHRLYWLKELCDRVIYLREGRIALDIPMAEFCGYSAGTLAELDLRTLSLAALPQKKIQPPPAESLTLRGYRYAYPTGRSPALDIPQSSLPKGGVIAVLGHNGAGKSTFSKCLCGLVKHQKGVCVCGEVPYSRRRMLKKSYMVMQDVNHQLFCESVEEELRLGMSGEDQAELERVMSALELTSFRERHPLSLSGGQKQRVAIASALLAGKEFLVFDEPTSGLDFRHMEQTAGLLASLGGKQTVFIVTHDPELIVRCCNYVLCLEQGTIKEQYPLDEAGLNRLRHFFEYGEKEGISLKRS